MNVNDLVLPKSIDGDIDITKKRVEIKIKNESGGSIIAYYPIEYLQVYVYDISSNQIPDMWNLGLRMNYSGRYLRLLVCRHGHGEFVDKGKDMNLSGGEFCMKYVQKTENRFLFTADNLIGVEVVLQVDYATEESFLMRMLKNTISRLGLSEKDFLKDQWYFSDFSIESKKVLDRLIDNCTNGADSALALINVAELVYNLGYDYKALRSKERKYHNNIQKAIAEDMHRRLTENYNQRWTAAMFAEKYGMSDTTVKNYFKSIYGYGFKEYQIKIRMEKASELLLTTKMKQVEIALAVGYSSQTKFINAFKGYYLMTPAAYRRRKRLSEVIE